MREGKDRGIDKDKDKGTCTGTGTGTTPVPTPAYAPLSEIRMKREELTSSRLAPDPDEP